jgi:hypothetical protein
MRLTFFTFLLLAASCGENSKPAPDLAMTLICDAAVAPPIDISMNPVDMFSPCTLPRPGIYLEIIPYTYQAVSGGNPTFTSSSSTVVVKNSGALQHASNSPYSPDRFDCSFTSIDPTTCTALCCPGQLNSPIIYADGGGWAMITPGSCQFTGPLNGGYIANIGDIQSLFRQ